MYAHLVAAPALGGDIVQVLRGTIVLRDPFSLRVALILIVGVRGATGVPSLLGPRRVAAIQDNRTKTRPRRLSRDEIRRQTRLPIKKRMLRNARQSMQNLQPKNC